jgi:hypothetical protein
MLALMHNGSRTRKARHIFQIGHLRSTGYAPDHYSQQQLDELNRLTEQWIEEHYRRHHRT